MQKQAELIPRTGKMTPFFTPAEKERKHHFRNPKRSADNLRMGIVLKARVWAGFANK